MSVLKSVRPRRRGGLRVNPPIVGGRYRLGSPGGMAVVVVLSVNWDDVKVRIVEGEWKRIYYEDLTPETEVLAVGEEFEVDRFKVGFYET